MAKRDKVVEALVLAAKSAVNHLEACEAGRIIHPFKSASLPMLYEAIKLAEDEAALKVQPKKKSDPKVEILHKGSLLTFLRKGADKETCVGYLMNFEERGIHDAHLGQIDVTLEQAEIHNNLLSEAEIKGLVENCAINVGGAFYLDEVKREVRTFVGTVVAPAEIHGSVVTFRKAGMVFRGRRSPENDIFHFKRIS